MTQKTLSSFTICHIFALEINYFPVLLSVRALLARSSKRNKRKVVSGSRVTLPENFFYKPGLSFNPLARVTLTVGLPYLLVNRALIRNQSARPRKCSENCQRNSLNWVDPFFPKNIVLTSRP